MVIVATIFEIGGREIFFKSSFQPAEPDLAVQCEVEVQITRKTRTEERPCSAQPYTAGI